MPGDPVFVGIELTSQAIRVVAGCGRQRSSVSGAGASAPQEWLELALYGLAVAPHRPLYAAIAVPAETSESAREEIVAAARTVRFAGAFVCPSPWALARGSERTEAAVAVVVDPRSSSIALVRGSAPLPQDQDRVRPIAGREARELAIAVRCLVKPHSREVARALLRNIVVAGDEEELDRIGRRQIIRELEALPGTAEIAADPFVAAAGAERLASELEADEWERLGEAPPAISF